MQEEQSGRRPLKARLLAFYLPQFHPIPENDSWWGRGFTEWTNVAKAKPLYRDHDQPHLPADLGFYDLRVPEVREQQAALARDAGVEGFVYWHYWFGDGRRVLERPFQEVLESGAPDFPFCLAWANQSWTGVWHGDPKSVLIQQRYPGPEDDRAHFALLEPAFRDGRYVKVDGKPVLVLLDPRDHPDPSGFVRTWRALAQAAGFPGIYLVAMWNKGADKRLDGFDAISSYGPGDFLETTLRPRWRRRIRSLRRGDYGTLVNRLVGTRFLKPHRFPYTEVVDRAFTGPLARDARFVPTVVPNWDNTPRSGNRGIVFERSTPALFGRQLQKAVGLVGHRAAEERIVFLKAWNEWAEGNYVEPDAVHGHGYLASIREAVG